eukprot:TRINITY_DN26689_c0_g1_i1.p1 TRINITY_DN26689_c0_g1~~TRINITY_DN26689_c0_g1_i1.p1  ORF type:complete len:153 (-),score=19.04 TRINITY_DN26689_c0_g1_i1:27-422(-)
MARIVFALLFAAFACANAGVPVIVPPGLFYCPTDTFKGCLTTYFKDLQLSDMPSSAQTFKTFLETSIDTSDKFAALCGATKKLVQCIGSYSIDCLSVTGFKDLEITDEDAISYANIFGNLAYQSKLSANVL